MRKWTSHLQRGDGAALKVHGYVNLNLEIEGIKMSHSFYVAQGMNRKVILSRYWKYDHGVYSIAII